MGMFATVEQRDYETLSSLTYDADDVFPSVADSLPDSAKVSIQFREYELYERALVFRGTTQKQCIDVTVKYAEWSGMMGKQIASQTSAWRKERGPSSGWDFQVRACLDRVKQQLREKYGNVEQFEDTVETVVETQ